MRSTRVHRFEPHQGVGSAGGEVAIEGLRQLRIRTDRDVVRSRCTRRHLHAADERIERTEGTSRQIIRIGTLAGTRLIVIDVRIAADQNQVAGVIEHRHDRIGTSQTIGVIDVEDRRPSLVAIVATTDRLNELVVQLEAVPVDVVGAVRFPPTLSVLRSEVSRLPSGWAEPKTSLVARVSTDSPSNGEWPGMPMTSIPLVAKRISAPDTNEPGFSSSCRKRICS